MNPRFPVFPVFSPRCGLPAPVSNGDNKRTQENTSAATMFAVTRPETTCKEVPNLLTNAKGQQQSSVNASQVRFHNDSGWVPPAHPTRHVQTHAAHQPPRMLTQMPLQPTHSPINRPRGRHHHPTPLSQGRSCSVYVILNTKFTTTANNKITAKNVGPNRSSNPACPRMRIDLALQWYVMSA